MTYDELFHGTRRDERDEKQYIKSRTEYVLPWQDSLEDFVQDAIDEGATDFEVFLEPEDCIDGGGGYESPDTWLFNVGVRTETEDANMEYIHSRSERSDFANFHEVHNEAEQVFGGDLKYLRGEVAKKACTYADESEEVGVTVKGLAYK